MYVWISCGFVCGEFIAQLVVPVVVGIDNKIHVQIKVNGACVYMVANSSVE